MDRILERDEIYKLLTTALIEKVPHPPHNWCISQLDEELFRSSREFEPNPLIRQNDALDTSLFYLVNYAQKMPERINLTEGNSRVKKMCEDLAFEIERITNKPESVIAERGKLKDWLRAILSVGTCIIYGEETERFIAERKKVKRLDKFTGSKNAISRSSQKSTGKWQSDLAKAIFQNTLEVGSKRSTDQPNLF